uniref:Lrp/AsnC family transcriptional regulator n=1 Tax=Archaeoglobus fulgidus TaxID=2234 RepID=A0A7C3M8T1_ARCFL
MDEKDMLILSELIKDSRKTLSELAEMLNMSVSSIHKRVKKLEKEGIIECYTAIVNPDVFDSVTAFLLVSAENPEKIFNNIKSIGDVVEVYKALGNFNMIVKVRSNDLDRIGEIVSKISSMQGVMMVECIVTTRRLKESVWFPDLR